MSASSPKSRKTIADTRRGSSVYDGRLPRGHVRFRASTWPDGRDALGEWIRLD